MDKEHMISEEVLDKIAQAITQEKNWMAYNRSIFYLEAGDVFFFQDKEAALSMSASNYSDQDHFNILHFETISDVYRQVIKMDSIRNIEGVNPDRNGLYDPDGNAFTDELISFWEQQQIINTKINFMKEENFQYLKDNIKYMGFGEGLNESLEANLKQGKSEFTLNHKMEVNKKPFEANLHFRKSDNSDMYFFNSYNASLQRNNGEKMDQTFYLTKGKGVTAKEAYNLLEGRSVHKELNTKEGQAYKAWIQLDFANKDKHNNHEVKQFHENYGYDLKAAVSKFAVSELKDPEQEKALLHSLQKGNIQSVSIEKDGNVSKMFMEANPQFKTVNLYDAQFKRMHKEDLSQYHSVKQTKGKEAKMEQKEDLKQDNTKQVKQKAGDDMDGIKKKTSHKKGLKV